MELLQLRYFLALSETESITKTAKALYITPSSLSLTISRLEKELGVPLFLHKSRSIELTPAGRVYAAGVREAYDILTRATALVKAKDYITLGFTNPTLWAVPVSLFSKAHPDTVVNGSMVSAGQVTEQMLLKEVSFWMTVGMPAAAPPNTEYRILSPGSLYLAVPESHRLASRSSVRLEELSEEDFIFPPLDNPSHQRFLDLCQRGGYRPNIAANCGFSLRMQMVALGRGISFSNAKEQFEQLYKGIRFLEIENVRDYAEAECTLIFWHKERQMTETEKLFLDFMLRYHKKLIEEMI